MVYCGWTKVCYLLIIVQGLLLYLVIMVFQNIFMKLLVLQIIIMKLCRNGYESRGMTDIIVQMAVKEIFHWDIMSIIRF